MKKLTALVLIFCVFMAAVPIAAAAENFSDVPDGSIKSYIDDMTDRGLFTGYGDGTFKPDKEITLLESLVLMSRLCTADDETKQLVLNDYNGYLTGILAGKGINWAYINLAVCLETGIVTKDELKDFASSGALGKPVQKELLSVFLIRAMQLEAEALSLTGYKVSFSDYLFITYSRLPYVYMLNLKGIVQGDSKNNFNPKSTVTRAIACIMLSRTLSYMEDNNIAIKITRYSEYRTYGVLAEVGSGNILVREYNGTLTRITVPASAYIKADGIGAALSGSNAGKLAALVWSKEDQSLKGIELDTKTVVVQGSVKSADIQTAVPKIYITDLSTGTVNGFNLGSTPTAYYEGTAIKTGDIKSGNYITALLQNNVVTTVYTYSGTYDLNVTLNTRKFGDPIILSVSDSAGKKTEIWLDPDALPAVVRGGNISNADKLRSGDTLKITVKNCVITRIDAQVQAAAVTGTIRKIVKDLTGSILTIANAEGTELSYQLEADAAVTQGTSRLSVDSLKIGSKVSLSLSDNYVTAITVDEAVSSSSVISGAVMFINNTDQTLLLQKVDETGKYITVHISYSTKILSALNGSYLSLGSLKIYNSLDIYGAYNGDQFEATVIVLR